MSEHSYGYIKDDLDERDLFFEPRTGAAAPQPVDLSLKALHYNITAGLVLGAMPPVYDQKKLGSCTANAIAADVDYERVFKDPDQSFMNPSRLFIYWNEREIEGSTATDSGAQIRDGFKSIAAQGVCAEFRWPYVVSKFAERPFHGCYGAAKWHRTLKYFRLRQDAAHMLDCLEQQHPFVFGINVFPSLESVQVGRTGYVPMPEPGESSIGGHALLAVGFNFPLNRIIFRNSWGSDWGEHGYGSIPLAYLLDPQLASDFWTIRLEE